MSGNQTSLLTVISNKAGDMLNEFMEKAIPKKK